MTLGTGIQKRTERGTDFSIDGTESTISAKIPENILTESRRNPKDELIYLNPSYMVQNTNSFLPSLGLVRFAKIKPFIALDLFVDF